MQKEFKSNERDRGGQKSTLTRPMAERRLELSKNVRGELLAEGILAAITRELFVLALRYHPDGVEPDEDKFVKYSNLAASYARDLLPYQSARLSPITQPPLPPDNRSSAELRAELVEDLARLGMNSLPERSTVGGTEAQEVDASPVHRRDRP